MPESKKAWEKGEVERLIEDNEEKLRVSSRHDIRTLRRRYFGEEEHITTKHIHEKVVSMKTA